MIVIVCHQLLSHIKLSVSSEVEGDGLVKADIYCVFHNVNISRSDCKKPKIFSHFLFSFSVETKLLIQTQILSFLSNQIKHRPTRHCKVPINDKNWKSVRGTMLTWPLQSYTVQCWVRGERWPSPSLSLPQWRHEAGSSPPPHSPHCQVLRAFVVVCCLLLMLFYLVIFFEK